MKKLLLLVLLVVGCNNPTGIEDTGSNSNFMVRVTNGKQENITVIIGPADFGSISPSDTTDYKTVNVGDNNDVYLIYRNNDNNIYRFYSQPTTNHSYYFDISHAHAFFFSDE